MSFNTGKRQWVSVETLNFGSISANSDAELVVTLPFAPEGVLVMPPFGIDAGLVFSAYAAHRNEVQNYAHDHTGGTFTLSFGGAETGDLAYNISNANLKAALEALSTITLVNVTGSAGDWDIEFVNPGLQDVAALVDDDTNLTGGASSAVTESTKGAVKGTVHVRATNVTAGAIDPAESDFNIIAWM